jgi:hypothetical protein
LKSPYLDDSVYSKRNNDLVLASDSVYDIFLQKFKLSMIESGISIYHKEISISSSQSDIFSFFEALDGCNVFQNLHRNSDVYFFPEKNLMISSGVSDALTVLRIWGAKDAVDEINTKLIETFDPPGSYVRWIYDSTYLESMNVSIPNRNRPFTEMYPFLNGETLEDYYDRFIESDASILVLLGPPGTAKTSFCRGLIQHTKKNAILTYHTKLLESDEFFAEWFKSQNESIVIMEDADTLLLPRTEGNSLMSRFLSLGDGLISIKDKKMIFTTNLPNTTSIDSALTRAGRCHDILEFSPLSRTQAKIVADKSGISLNGDASSYTIAEIFSDTKTRKVTKKSSFGFI